MQVGTASPITTPAETALDGADQAKTTPAEPKTSGKLARDQDGFEAPKRVNAPVIHNHLSLPYQREFKALPEQTQREVLERMKTHASPDSPAARQNYAKLALDPGFAKLSPEHQKQALEALDKAPKDRGLSDDLRALVGTEGFRKLNSATGSEVLRRMGSTDATARANLMSLAGSEGFRGLNPGHQKQMLEVLDQRPKDVGLMVDLHAAATSSGFRNLSDSAKSELICGLGRNAADPAARTTLVNLADTKGLGKMADEDKLALIKVAGGSSAAYSGAARKELDALMSKPEFKNGSEDDQARMLKDVLKNQDFLPGATTAPDGAFDGKRASYTVSAPTALPNGDQRYDVSIEGKTIPVTLHPTQAGLTSYSADEVAKALAAVPKSQRDQITEVSLEPKQDPQGAYMRSNSTGKVWVYPGTPPLANDTFMASAMIHETGHIVSGKKWGDDTGDPRWSAWKDAMKQDQISPSKYGHTTPGQASTKGGGSAYADDFAETALLYARVKGTPEEAEMRRLMPERFRILDGM